MKNPIKICAHLYAYTRLSEGGDLWPLLDQIFADFAAAGLEGIELMHTVLDREDSVERIGNLSAEHEVPVIGSSFGGNMWDPAQTQEVLARAEQVINAVADLGGHTLGTSTGSTGEKKTPEQLDTQAEVLRQIMAIAESRGVTMNLHNHTYEVQWNEHEVRENIARIPTVKLGPDLNWLRRAGVEPLGFLRRHADRVVFLHLRDQKGERWTEALGEGDEDYVALAKVLDEIDYKGEATIELAHERDQEFTRPMGELFKVSCENLRHAFGL